MSDKNKKNIKVRDLKPTKDAKGGGTRASAFGGVSADGSRGTLGGTNLDGSKDAFGGTSTAGTTSES